MQLTIHRCKIKCSITDWMNVYMGLFQKTGGVEDIEFPGLPKKYLCLACS